MVVAPGLDECSTIAAQRPLGAIAQLVDRTLDFSTDQDLKPPACHVASELPSIGSLGHGQGCCKPCGFMHHKDGCSAGVGCNFCHLCPPGTIERQRQKQRKLVRAARRDSAHQNSSLPMPGTSPSDGSVTPPEHYAPSECSTVDTQGAEVETPSTEAAKSSVNNAISMPSTSFGTRMRMLSTGTRPASADCASSHDRPLGSVAPGPIDGHQLFVTMYSHVAASNSAAASANIAAARVMALQKRGGA